MKAQNKIILGLLVAISSIMTPLSHAIVVGVDPTANWVGYMNVHAKDWSWYAFGSPWTVSALKTTVSANGLTLQPNFNCYADNVNGAPGDRAFWTDGAGGGNKWMEGSTLVEKAAGVLSGSLTFTGNVDSYSLASGYSVIAFIKGLNAGNNYSTDLFQQVAIGSGTSSFSVSADLTGASGLIMQYGFTVSGKNANPAQSGLGSAVISAAAIPEPSSVSLLVLGAAGLMGLQLRRKS